MAKNETAAAEAETAAAAADEGAQEGETKREAFERIATRRVGNVLTAIRLLEGLTNKANYDYTSEHWDEIFGAVSGQMNQLVDRYNGKIEAKSGFGFSK